MSILAHTPTKSDIAKDVVKSEIARKHHVARPTAAGIDWEHSTQALHQALPAGYTYCMHEREWLDEVMATIDLTTRRADYAKNFVAFCHAIAERIDATHHGIVRCTWDYFCRTVGISRSTVSRIIAELKAAKLLAVVSSGRSENAKKPIKGMPKMNLAPVYGLIRPTPLPTAPHRVSENYREVITDTPSPLKETEKSFLHAVRSGCMDVYNKHQYNRYYTKYKDSLTKKRQGLDAHYPTKKTRTQALNHLTRVLQHHANDLRELSPRTILSITQPFFEEGWTAWDILHACEYRPDGTQWRTSGAGGMRSKAAWLKIRLTAWQDAGGIIDSYTAQRAAAHEAQRKQAADENAQQQRKTCTEQGRLAAKRRIKIALLGEKKARHQHPELF